MLVVKKFGGTSVENRERIYNVARRCIEDYRAGHSVVVVLSAMGDTTDRLIEEAHAINAHPPKRELDMLLSVGEQMSVAYMAMAIHSLGVPVISLNAFQVPMVTTSEYGSAKLKRIETERIRNELEQHKIVIVTGFQGINRYEDVTTLGRGGSDTTAVALAAALHADSCEIFTDVDGVYTADPRVVPDAKLLPESSYSEMLEMASLGARGLHNRSVELAKKYGVKLVVRSSLNGSEGTVVREESKMERLIVSGVASDKNVARISVMGVENEPGIAFKVFNTLAQHNINVDIILQSVGRDGTKDIAFTVAKSDVEEAEKVVQDSLGVFTAKNYEVETGIAKVSIIGAGMNSHPGVAARMFEALSNAGINIKMISTSEIRITVVVEEADADRAVRRIHSAFDLADL